MHYPGFSPGHKKSSSVNQMSFNILRKVFKAVDLTYLFRQLADGIGTFAVVCETHTTAGCQGFIGPLPSAFLDKRCLKNCHKDIINRAKLPNKKCQIIVKKPKILYCIEFLDR
jgi:hypothetical protein